jgi:hypothetical protein
MLRRLDVGLRTRADEAAARVAEVKTAAEVAAARVEEVSETLRSSTAAAAAGAAAQDRKLDGLAVVARSTHTLVNSERGALLKVAAVALRRLARAADATRDDVEAADEAERLYADHQAKQSDVDAQPGTDEDKGGGTMRPGVAP